MHHTHSPNAPIHKQYVSEGKHVGKENPRDYQNQNITQCSIASSFVLYSDEVTALQLWERYLLGERRNRFFFFEVQTEMGECDRFFPLVHPQGTKREGRWRSRMSQSAPAVVCLPQAVSFNKYPS